MMFKLLTDLCLAIKANEALTKPKPKPKPMRKRKPKPKPEPSDTLCLTDSEDEEAGYERDPKDQEELEVDGGSEHGYNGWKPDDDNEAELEPDQAY